MYEMHDALGSIVDQVLGGRLRWSLLRKNNADCRENPLRIDAGRDDRTGIYGFRPFDEVSQRDSAETEQA